MAALTNFAENKSRLRGRPRSESSHAAVLEATTELMKSMPLRDLTIEAIAKKAGVGKITIYRWWPSKAYVALDAVLESLRLNVKAPNTGSTEKDLARHLRSVIRFYKSPVGRTFRQLLAEGQNDPEFGLVFLERYLRPRRKVVADIWNRGVERGDVNPDVDADVAIDLISGPMIYRLMSGHTPLTEDEAEVLVASAFWGLHSQRTETSRRNSDKQNQNSTTTRAAGKTSKVRKDER